MFLLNKCPSGAVLSTGNTEINNIFFPFPGEDHSLEKETKKSDQFIAEF